MLSSTPSQLPLSNLRDLSIEALAHSLLARGVALHCHHDHCCVVFSPRCQTAGMEVNKKVR